MTKIELKGTFGQVEATELRASLDGHSVVLTSGFGGERILKAVGDFTSQQWQAVRTFLLRLLDEKRIDEFTIDGNKVTIRGASEDNLPQIVESAEKLIDKMNPKE